MNRQNDSTCGPLNVNRDPLSQLDLRVCALLGRRVIGLHVEVRDGGLVLHGRAASYHAKQLAQHVAMAATDLPLVANRIDVISPQHETPRAEEAVFGERVAQPPKGGVLLATDDDRLRSAGHDHLTAQGYVVATAGGGVECVAILREFTPDVVVLDADLLWGGADGVLENLRAWDGPNVPTVLITSPFTTLPGSGAGALPVVLVIEKPVGVGTLLWAVRSVVGGRLIARPKGWPAAGEEAPLPPV
jgi:CheY-like chemotaxis protein